MTLMLTLALAQLPDAVTQYFKEVEKQVVEMAPKDSAMDAEEWKKAIKEYADITAYSFKNQSLTVALNCLTFSPGSEVEFDKDFGQSMSTLNDSLEKNGYSLVQNVKVTALAVDGQGRASGTFEFSGGVIKRGWVEFRAKTEKGKLTITEFNLPISKMNIVLQPDGTWAMLGLAWPAGFEAPADGIYECLGCRAAIGEAPNDVSTVKVKKGDKFLPCPRHKDGWWRSR